MKMLIFFLVRSPLCETDKLLMMKLNLPDRCTMYISGGGRTNQIINSVKFYKLNSQTHTCLL